MDAVDGHIGKVAIGILTALSVGIGVWILSTTYMHTGQITEVATEVHDLATAIAKHDLKEDNAVGGLIAGELEQAKELAALRQELRDAEIKSDAINARQDRVIDDIAPRKHGH